jgi:hypothetical protein
MQRTRDVAVETGNGASDVKLGTDLTAGKIEVETTFTSIDRQPLSQRTHSLEFGGWGLLLLARPNARTKRPSRKAS